MCRYVWQGLGWRWFLLLFFRCCSSFQALLPSLLLFLTWGLIALQLLSLRSRSMCAAVFVSAVVAAATAINAAAAAAVDFVTCLRINVNFTIPA